MKVCKNCNQENPSSAKFCMICGAAFVEEKPQSQDDLFRKELDEVKETIEQLKKTLAALQEKTENIESESEKEQLTKQIDDGNKTIKTLSGQIDEKKNEISTLTNQLEKERKKKKGGKWGWIFVLLWLVFAFGVYWYWDCYDNEKNRGYCLKDTIYELEKQNKALVEKYPLIIKSVDVVNSDQVEGKSRRSGKTLKVSYEGYSDAKTKLLFKLYLYGEYFHTFAEIHTINKGNHILEINLKNGVLGSSWPNGNYQIEIWYSDVALASKSFEKLD